MGIFKRGSWKTNKTWGATLVAIGIAVCSCANAGEQAADLPLNSSVDLQPVLVVDSPSRAWIADMTEVEVSGHIEHWNPKHDLFVNNQVTNVFEDGSFSLLSDVNSGINFIETKILSDELVVAEDKRSILNARATSIDTNLEDSLFLNLGENIFNHIGDIATHAIMNIDFVTEYGGDLISGNGGCSNSVWFRDLTIEDTDFEFDFEPGRLQINIRVTNPVFYMRARYARDTFFGCVRDTTNASVSNDEIRIRINYQMGTDDSGQPFVQFENADAELSGFDLDVGSYPDSFIRWLAGDVAGDLEQQIEETIEEESTEALEGILGDLVPDAFTSSTGDVTLESTPHLSQFGATSHGLNLSFGMTSKFLDREIQGQYWSVGPEESLAAPAPHPDQIGLGLSFEILNQALAIAWQAGEFEQTINASDIPDELNIENDDLADALFSLKIQPVIRYDEEHGGLVFELGEAHVLLHSTHGDLLFETHLAIRAQIGFSRNEDTGFVKIDLNEFVGHSSIAENNNSDINAFLVDALIEYEIGTVIAEANRIFRSVEIDGATYSEIDDDDGSFGFRTTPSHLWFQIDPRVLFPL